MINHWQVQDVWDRECKDYPGFAKVMGSKETISLQEFQMIVDSVQKRFC